MVQELSGKHDDLISSLVYFPGCKLLFSGSYDSTITSWLYKPESRNFEFQEQLHDISGSIMSLSYVKILGRSEALVSLSEDGTFKIWKNKLPYINEDEIRHPEIPIPEEEMKRREKLILEYEIDSNIELKPRKATITSIVSVQSIGSLLMTYEDGKICQYLIIFDSKLMFFPVLCTPYDIASFSSLILLTRPNGGLYEGFGVLTAKGEFCVLETDTMKNIENAEKGGQDENEKNISNPSLVTTRRIKTGLIG